MLGVVGCLKKREVAQDWQEKMLEFYFIEPRSISAEAQFFVDLDHSLHPPVMKRRRRTLINIFMELLECNKS